MGLEPIRPFRAKGFSYHYGFRHHYCLWSGLFLHHGFMLFRCAVSSLCTFLLSKAWLKIAIGVTRYGFLEFTAFYISLFRECTQMCLSPSCLPFHHQGLREARSRTAKIVKITTRWQILLCSCVRSGVEPELRRGSRQGRGLRTPILQARGIRRQSLPGRKNLPTRCQAQGRRLPS